MAIKFGMSVADMILQLTKGFIKATGRKPEALEKIKIQQEAAQRFKDMNKVVDMEGKTIDTSKGIMGGKQAKAMGGRIGLKDGISLESILEGKIPSVKMPDPLQEILKKMTPEEKEMFKMRMEIMRRGFEINPPKNPEGVKPIPMPTYPKENRADGGRIGYKLGSIDKARRAFLKTAAGVGGGIAALKTGLLGFSKKAPEVVEKVTENFSTTLSEAPNYFFDLVTKIKSFGKQSKVGPSERVNEYSYIGKNGDQYTLTEDIATGDAQIVKDKMGVGSYGDKTFDTINDRTVMEYKAPKQDVDVETGRGTREAAEYEEYKVEFDSDGTEAGADAIDEMIQKEIIEEAVSQAPSIKKASGGIARMLGE